MLCSRRETEDGRRETGDGRRETGVRPDGARPRRRRRCVSRGAQVHTLREGDAPPFDTAPRRLVGCGWADLRTTSDGKASDGTASDRTDNGHNRRAETRSRGELQDGGTAATYTSTTGLAGRDASILLGVLSLTARPGERLSARCAPEVLSSADPSTPRPRIRREHAFGMRIDDDTAQTPRRCEKRPGRSPWPRSRLPRSRLPRSRLPSPVSRLPSHLLRHLAAHSARLAGIPVAERVAWGTSRIQEKFRPSRRSSRST